MIKSNGKEITSIYTRDGKEIIEVRDNQNNIVYSAIDEISGSVPLSFMSRGGYLQDYRIYGNTVQNGIPTPENPVEVQGCGEYDAELNGYKIPVTVEGQPNALFTESIDNVNKQGVIWSIKNGFVTVVGTASGHSNPAEFMINRAGMAGDFRINKNVQQVSVACRVVKNGKESYPTGIIHLDGTERTVVFYPQVYAGTYNVTFFPTIKRIITTPVYIGNEPLHKIGDYADYVDFNRGVVVRKIKKLVLTGEDGEWEKSGTRTGSFYFRLENDAVEGFGLCDRAVNAISIDVYSSSGKVFVERSGQNTLINVWLFDTNISIANFKSYLAAQYTAGTPVTIWYVLATPEEEPLENLLPIQTIKGSDILTVDTTVQPSNIWIKGKIKAID